MYVGDKNRIDVSSSQFSDFIENNNLYVDKTAFIEHVLQDASKVLLFTRPRRMGKSLNMNTLATFLDCKQNTAQLFKGLYVETSAVYNQINKYPVIYLSFRELDIDDYKRRFKHNLMEIANRYLKEEQYSPKLVDYFNDKNNYNTGALLDLTKNLYSVYGVKPYIIIDEYDKPLMDNIYSPELPEFKKWITSIFGSAMKDNPALGKAVLTGVTRIAKENMFSGLNNLEVYDVLKISVYDTDFSLTENELLELIPEEKIEGVRKWYNNMRVGKELLYNIYSVMNYLRNPEHGLMGYWSMTGGGNLLASLLTDLRAEIITRMLNDNRYRYDIKLDHQLNMDHIKNTSLCDDTSFYTLAVQAGYLSFEPIDYESAGFKVFIPNMEASKVWSRLILEVKYNSVDNKLYNIFAGIENVNLFSKELTDFTSMVLSYNDFKVQPEWVYHVFFLGLMYSLGYECKSNLEAGSGRFDIYMKSRRFCAIIEFKVSKLPNDVKKEVEEALKQIDDKEYWYELKNTPLPLYKIGIACHGKKCLVKTSLHKKDLFYL